MDNVLLETISGRIHPGLAEPPILSSRGKPWNGFHVKEHGPTEAEVHEVMLLKHVICLQISKPAEIKWQGDGRFVNKSIEPGQISIYPANKLHSGAFRHAGGHIAVFLEPEFLAQAMDKGVATGQVELRWEHGVDSPALRELVLLLHAEARQSNAPDGHYATAIARLIAIHLVQHSSVKVTGSAKQGGLSPTRMRKVMDYIEQRVGEQLSLSELAAAAGLSVFHFSRVFRQSTGMSPFQYVMKCRIGQAKKLLLEPDARIGDIALECGFCDQAHLTRHFKRLAGVTPAVFVRSLGHRNISR